MHPPSASKPLTVAKTQPLARVAAIASLLCGVLGLLLIGLILVGFFASEWSFVPGFGCGALGAALGHLARRATRRSSDDVLVTAGLVLSYGGAILAIALIVAIAWILASAGPFPPGN
jgi:hypothetical protein